MFDVTIDTKAICTWPSDDVTIIQEVTRGGERRSIQHIGLSITNIDQLIMQLRIARCTAQEWERSYTAFCITQAKTRRQ